MSFIGILTDVPTAVSHSCNVSTLSKRFIAVAKKRKAWIRGELQAKKKCGHNNGTKVQEKRRAGEDRNIKPALTCRTPIAPSPPASTR